MIPYGKQNITQADIDSVVDVLKSDWLTQGPLVPRFESSVASSVGAQHAVAVNSATSALHIACRALELGPGDWLWTSPNTFVASANCALYCGAQVDFIDIDPLTYNMCAKQLAIKLEVAEKEGKLPKVVIPVHFSGQSCDMQAIFDLSKKYGFKVIEDASHAIGGKYKGKPVGNCQHSDITIFSFHPVKIVTTGEGGVAVTNDADLCKKMKQLSGHGITRDKDIMIEHPDGPWYYEQQMLGYNYRMTDMQAALGVSQLTRLEAFISQRHEIACSYDELLKDSPMILPYRDKSAYSAFHLYVIRLCLSDIKLSRLEVFEQLRASGIGVNIHYIPVYLQPYYQAQGFTNGYCKAAEAYYEEAISLPMFPTLKLSEQQFVVSKIMTLLGE